MSGSTAQDGAWKGREQAEEARYAKAVEQRQLEALRASLGASKDASKKESVLPTGDIEGGYGGQEDLEDRYATTSGDH